MLRIGRCGLPGSSGSVKLDSRQSLAIASGRIQLNTRRVTPNSYAVIPAGRGVQTSGWPLGLDRLELWHNQQCFHTVDYVVEDLDAR